MLCSITILTSGMIEVKNRLVQEDKDIEISGYVMVGEEYVSKRSVLANSLRKM